MKVQNSYEKGGENVLLAAKGDVDFMIHGLFKYRLFGQEFWITTTHVSILIVMLVLLIFAIAANRKIRHASEIPGGFQNVVELIVEMLDKMVYGSMGKHAGKFLNYIGTIFLFILVSNLSGLFGLRAFLSVVALATIEDLVKSSANKFFVFIRIPPFKFGQ